MDKKLTNKELRATHPYSPREVATMVLGYNTSEISKKIIEFINTNLLEGAEYIYFTRSLKTQYLLTESAVERLREGILWPTARKVKGAAREVRARDTFTDSVSKNDLYFRFLGNSKYVKSETSRIVFNQFFEQAKNNYLEDVDYKIEDNRTYVSKKISEELLNSIITLYQEKQNQDEQELKKTEETIALSILVDRIGGRFNTRYDTGNRAELAKLLSDILIARFVQNKDYSPIKFKSGFAYRLTPETADQLEQIFSRLRSKKLENNISLVTAKITAGITSAFEQPAFRFESDLDQEQIELLLALCVMDPDWAQTFGIRIEERVASHRIIMKPKQTANLLATLHQYRPDLLFIVAKYSNQIKLLSHMLSLDATKNLKSD